MAIGRAAKMAGAIGGSVTLLVTGAMALLASIARFPHGDGSATPFLVWPLKIVAFVLALAAATVIAMLVGAIVEGIVRLARLLRRG